MEKFSPPLEKCVGCSLKHFGPLRKLFAPLVCQAGYGPRKCTKTTSEYAQKIKNGHAKLKMATTWEASVMVLCHI